MGQAFGERSQQLVLLLATVETSFLRFIVVNGPLVRQCDHHRTTRMWEEGDRQLWNSHLIHHTFVDCLTVKRRTFNNIILRPSQWIDDIVLRESSILILDQFDDLFSSPETLINDVSIIVATPKSRLGESFSLSRVV